MIIPMSVRGLDFTFVKTGVDAPHCIIKKAAWQAA
jgi:hypothetical protein